MVYTLVRYSCLQHAAFRMFLRLFKIFGEGSFNLIYRSLTIVFTSTRMHTTIGYNTLFTICSWKKYENPSIRLKILRGLKYKKKPYKNQSMV